MHVRRSLALLVAVPLLLAGCTEEPEPTPKMPDPTTSSPSPTVGESETPTQESPEDFIRRWADALREMQVSGQTDEFLALGPNCKACTETASRVEAIYAQGGEIQWDGWKIVNIRPFGSSSTEFRVVETSAPTRFRETAVSRWQRLEGGRTPHVIELAPYRNTWRVLRTAELAR